MPKIYTIADETQETYGHGSFGKELRIVRQGGYGRGNFPPVFPTKDEAESYLKKIKFNAGKKVVELDYVEGEFSAPEPPP